MFTSKLKLCKSGHLSFKNEKCLINKQFKYRTLGEMVALARANGERPLPTRAGVYTGDMVIPVETTDKINFQKQLMEQYNVAEDKLKEATAQIVKDKKDSEDAAYRAKVISEYEASKQSVKE